MSHPLDLTALSDAELTALHAAVHTEWRIRRPWGDWPEPEQQERRAELRRQLRVVARAQTAQASEVTCD